MLLYGLVRYLKPDTILEVGAWQGHSTLHMAEACKDNGGIGHVYAVDNWSLAGGSEQAIKDALHLAQVDAYVTLLHGDSLAVEWPKVIDFAFIDGNHNRDYPEAEIARAVERGCKTLIVHDTTNWWGPRDWLADFRQHGNPDTWDVLELPGGDGLTILQRRTAKPDPQFTEAQYPQGFI